MRHALNKIITIRLFGGEIINKSPFENSLKEYDFSFITTLKIIDRNSLLFELVTWLYKLWFICSQSIQRRVKFYAGSVYYPYISSADHSFISFYISIHRVVRNKISKPFQYNTYLFRLKYYLFPFCFHRATWRFSV